MNDPVGDGIPCLWMRGGTSKAAIFLASDMPQDSDELHSLLLRIMGSPDIRQIDGIGGADPLTSKVAIISPSSHSSADVDYLFLQVFVDRPVVSSDQGCGNILAAIGPAAIERGLVNVKGDQTKVRIHMVNTGEIAVADVATPNGRVSYQGRTAIDGVPRTSAAVPLMFDKLAGSMTGALLPTGRHRDVIDGVECTLIDNGMPCVIMSATDFAISGKETPQELDKMSDLKMRLETIRHKAGPLMNLGDVTHKSVPKMVMVSPPSHGGTVSTRCFIPHKCHTSIGVFAAITVATAATLSDTPAQRVSNMPRGENFTVEHPSGSATVLLKRNSSGIILQAGTVRTARKLFDGRVFTRP